MKNLFTCILLLMCILLLNCSGDRAGDSELFKAGGVSFYLKHVPGGLAFFTGTDDSGIYGDDDGTDSDGDGLDDAPFPEFQIGDTEVTNQLVKVVFQWAYDKGKFDTDDDGDIDGDDNATLSAASVELYGQQLINLDGFFNTVTCGISYNSGVFGTSAGEEYKPCIYISWYGAVMFCNWLTEMIYGSESKVVYSWNDDGMGDGTAFDDIWQDDETVADTSKKGFRLPENMEWELAARYISDANGDSDILDAGEFYPGDHVSGDESSHCYPSSGASTVFGNFGWYEDNSAGYGSTHADYGTHIVGSSGISMVGLAGNPESKSSLYSNSLGLFDMSGNVWEWCFTKNSSGRINRGNSWNNHLEAQQLAAISVGGAGSSFYGLGFRIARTE